MWRCQTYFCCKSHLHPNVNSIYHFSAQRGNPSSTLGWKPELLGVRQGDVVAARLLLAGTEKA